jgi:hypothetical protein
VFSGLETYRSSIICQYSRVDNWKAKENINMDIRENASEGEDWIELALATGS